MADLAATDPYTVPMSGGWSLTFRQEPGDRPAPLYRLAMWNAQGQQSGGFTLTRRGAVEAFLALGRLAQAVNRGFPDE